MKYGADRKHKPRLAQAWPLDELTYSPFSDPGGGTRDAPCVREVVASLRNPQPVIELHVGGEQGLPS